MGIHRLLHHMQDFGTPVELGTARLNHTTLLSTDSTEDLERKYVVVDGPSLAYHAYHRAVAGRYHARNALEAMPSHGEVAVVAVDFLTTLESHNVNVVAIFFDGALPAAKHATRLHRLHSSLVQLQNFKNQHLNEVRCTPPKVNGDLFSAPTSLPEKLTALPAAAFLVPAVIDHLKQSKFSERVSVVPAEADVFCADVVHRISQKVECWLLSSDTDLLVFDLGPKGSVLRFQDVTLATFPRRTVLKGIEFHPKRIAERLGLKDLAPLAFALTQDPHKTLTELVKEAKSLDSSTAEYKAWFEEYTPINGRTGPGQLAINQYRSNFLVFPGKSAPFPSDYFEEPCLASAKQRQIRAVEKDAVTYFQYLVHSQTKILDPRVSELIHQVSYAIVTLKGQTKLYTPQTTCEGNCSMFLPFLIDDPTRASAWRLSADLRNLGCSIVSLPMDSQFTIQEYERRGQRIAPSIIPRFRYKKAEVVVMCQELSAHISAFMVNSGDLHLRAPLYFWKLYGALYLCDKLVHNGERQASKREVLRLLQGHNGQLEWPYIHRVAQLQGVWYSLRMLRQFLSVFLGYPVDSANKTDIHADPDVQKAVKDTYERLDGLPSATKFFDPVLADDEDAISESYLLAAIENFPSLADDPKELYDRAFAERKNKKRKKKTQGQAEGTKTGPKPQMGGNIFGALSALGDDG